MFLLSIFLYQKVENNQQMTERSSFGTPHGLLTYLLTLSLRTTPLGVFPDYFSFDHFWPLPIAAQQTSTTKLPAFFQKLKNTVRALKVKQPKQFYEGGRLSKIPNNTWNNTTAVIMYVAKQQTVNFLLLLSLFSFGTLQL